MFSILAASVTAGNLILSYTLIIVTAGLALTWYAMKMMRSAMGRENQEIRGLMVFSLGWQLVAVFGGLLLLDISGMALGDSVMANASAISHFGLFAAIQEGMFGPEAAGMIAFVFAMPFLVHPLVFGIFGKAAENEGVMPAKIVYGLTLIGMLGVIYAMVW